MKQHILQHIQKLILSRKEELLEAIRSAKESRDNDSKSSVGDKHETSRALAQIEIDKLEGQLEGLLHQETELASIHIDKKNTTIEKGSLVYTDKENYFISVGIGKVEIENILIYCISPVSPLGKLLLGKKTGEEVVLNGRKIQISEIV